MSNDSIVKFRSFDKIKCCFDIVAVFGNNVARLGNNVEATFDFVERTKFYYRIVRHVVVCGNTVSYTHLTLPTILRV